MLHIRLRIGNLLKAGPHRRRGPGVTRLHMVHWLGRVEPLAAVHWPHVPQTSPPQRGTLHEVGVVKRSQ
jgi:hypothetical protein